jgi:hypothetical protein
MKTFFRIFALVFTILFMLAVFVQYNDPDAFLWYLVYGVAAVASLLFFLGKLNYYLAAFLCTGYLLGSFLIWPEIFEGITIDEGDIINVERGREAIGLLLISVVMLIYALRLRFRSNS